MTGLGIEMLAELLVAAEILVVEQDVGADATERAGQLIMMGVAAFQAIVVDENLQFALAQRRAVEMRQIIDRGAGRVHRRLVNQMNLAEEIGVAGDRERQ